MSDSDLTFAGAAHLAEMVRGGEVTPTELAEHFLERIARLDPKLNSFRIVIEEKARAEAKDVEKRMKDAEHLPLAGVPIAIKDTDDVEGEATTLGTAAFPDPKRADGEMVRRLRAAGAVIVGKTNLPELAMFPYAESKTFGITRNPWDTTRSPGGSSGGSGAAVAAGLVPIASASDGGGSIRIPAAFNGLFGLKSQRDRIPLAPAREHWHGLSVTGCLARSVADSALWLDVTGGPVEGGPAGPPAPEHRFFECARAKPPKLKIAIAMKPARPIAPPILSDECEAAVDDAAAALRSLGHDVIERDLDFGAAIGNHMSARYLRGIADEVNGVADPSVFEAKTRGMAKIARAIPDPVLRAARRAEAKDARRVLKIFDEFDVVISPVTSELPQEVGRWAENSTINALLSISRRFPFCIPWNHLGNPAASVPVGLDSSGLPTAVQMIGRPNDEATLISLAAQFEAERPWADRVPAGFEPG